MPEPNKLIIKRTLFLVPPLVALLVVAELLWSDRVWMSFLVAVGGIWIFEWLWVHSLARSLRFRRELRYGWAQVGDLLEERFTLSNKGNLPALWVQVTDHSNLAGYDASRATGIGRWSENVWQNEHICSRRGSFHLGPTTITTGTPFGLYSLTFQYTALDSVIVTPPVVPLPEISISPGGRAYEGRRRASTFERTVNAAGVREYVHGDSFKAIHWRTTAHADELMVRTFDSTPAGDWWIWLDLDENAQAGAGENSTLEHSIILAASLAERGLRSGRAVGLILNAREFVWLAPSSAEFQRLQILRYLASVEPGSQSLAVQLATLGDMVDRHASVIFITPALDAEWLSQLLTFQSHTNVPTVILLDPASYGATTGAAQMDQELGQRGIPHFVITSDMMDRPEAHPGHQGRWEWRVGATGRAIANNTPNNSGWRTLT